MTVAATDVYNDNDKRMFQCKATSSENEIVFSDVATIEYSIQGLCLTCLNKLMFRIIMSCTAVFDSIET